MVIWPEAIKAQNSMAAVSADSRAHWVLMRRLNSSCRRSMASVVRNDFHCSGDVSQEGVPGEILLSLQITLIS